MAILTNTRSNGKSLKSINHRIGKINLYCKKIILAAVRRMDCRSKGRNKEANWEPTISVLVREDDGTTYCNGNGQGRRKFRTEVSITQDTLSFGCLSSTWVELPSGQLSSWERSQDVHRNVGVTQSEGSWRCSGPESVVP